MDLGLIFPGAIAAVLLVEVGVIGIGAVDDKEVLGELGKEKEVLAL